MLNTAKVGQADQRIPYDMGLCYVRNQASNPLNTGHLSIRFSSRLFYGYRGLLVNVSLASNHLIVSHLSLRSFRCLFNGYRR